MDASSFDALIVVHPNFEKPETPGYAESLIAASKGFRQLGKPVVVLDELVPM